MNKVYTLRPKGLEKLARIPKEVQVIFMWEKIYLGKCYQIVTTCLLRNRIQVIGGGFSIENPLDERDSDNNLGIQWSFKRAIGAMCRNANHLNKRKEVDTAFRLALYNARNGG